MSFGSGSIPDYLQRLRNSKIRKANRQKNFKGGNDYSKVKSVKTEYNFPKISRYKLSEFKKKIKREAKNKKNSELNGWILFSVIIILILILFNFYKF